ncbi:MAG: carboxymuconolactone decarboxylase family protein [Tepidiformaceae bacterium]
MSRLPLTTRDDIPEELRYVWDHNETDGRMANIFRAMSNNPKLWRSYLRLGSGLWADCGVDTKTRELAILRAAINAQSPYEWHQHVRIGRAAGLTNDQILGLHHWDTSPQFSDAEKAMFGYIDAVAASNHPSDAAHAAIAAHYPASTILGINLLTGFYLMTAKFVGGMEVETEEPFIGWQLQG